MGFEQESSFSLLGSAGSDTEVDTKGLAFRHDLRDFQKKLKRLQIFAAVLGTLTLLSLIFSTALYYKSKGSKHVSLIPSAALVPEFPHRPITFEENSIYSEAPSNKSNEAWGRLVPKGRGYIYVTEPEKYYLHQGLANSRNDGSQSYVISMYHQLHCIDILRLGYYAALEGKTTLHTHGKHLSHCFDYLRQAVMCAGDLTLEWPRVEKDGSRIGADGWGVTHECVDYDRVFMWTEERRGDDRTSIL